MTLPGPERECLMNLNFFEEVYVLSQFENGSLSIGGDLKIWLGQNKRFVKMKAVLLYCFQQITQISLFPQQLP